MALAPLVTANGPLGVITLGSSRPNSYGQEDLDLLAQLSTQIALAVENAVAYGRVARLRGTATTKNGFIWSQR